MNPAIAGFFFILPIKIKLIPVIYRKIFLKIWPILLLVGILSFFNIKGYYNYQRFYDESFNAIVIKRNNWQLRTTEFYLDNGIQIDSSGIPGYEFDLKKGDSIVKTQVSKKFKVFRKTGNIYKFNHEYLYDR
jgi:hypothetical protein